MQKQQKTFFCFYFRFPTVLPVVFQPPCRGCPFAAAWNSVHITVILKISYIAAPKLAARTAAIETAHILRSFYLCCLCRCGQQSASRMDFRVYRPILQAGNFCAILHFPCPLSPARLQGCSLCESTANSGAKVWYTARFCAILDKKSTQPGRARHKRGHT